MKIFITLPLFSLWRQMRRKRIPLDLECGRLAKIFGRDLVRLEHLGSTAVPGMKAKPLFDILVLLRDTRRIEQCVCPMPSCGYGNAGK